MFDLDTYRAVKELAEACRSGDDEKIQAWKDKYKDREDQDKKGTFRF